MYLPVEMMMIKIAIEEVMMMKRRDSLLDLVRDRTQLALYRLRLHIEKSETCEPKVLTTPITEHPALANLKYVNNQCKVTLALWKDSNIACNFLHFDY